MGQEGSLELSEEIYNRGQLSGGYLKDIPFPHIRLYPNPYYKRTVYVTISRYYGIGEHYYATISEEGNPIWNPEENLWQLAWDDKEGKGRTDTSLFFDGESIANIREEAYEIALGKCKYLVNKYFSDYDVRWEDYCKDYENE